MSAYYLSFRDHNTGHVLSGLEIVLVAPMGLVELEFVQSANWYQYFVSALRCCASTLTVKSTSKVVNASPESMALPLSSELSKILKETQTGILSAFGTTITGSARVQRRTESSKGSP